MNLSEGAEIFAKKIHSCISSNEISQLSMGARDIYNEKLSWQKWSEKFKVIIENNRYALPHL